MMHKKAKDAIHVNVEVNHNTVSLFLIQDNGNRAVSIGTFDRSGFWDELDGCGKETQEDLARDWVLDQLTVTLETHYKADQYKEEAIDRQIDEMKERMYANA